MLDERTQGDALLAVRLAAEMIMDEIRHVAREDLDSLLPRDYSTERRYMDFVVNITIAYKPVVQANQEVLL